jgi:hypothetical protein
VYRASDRAAVWTIAGPADGVAFLGNTKVVREEDEGAASVWCPTPSP